MPNDMCDVTCVNEEKVNHVKKKINIDAVNEAIHLYKLLADRNRLQIAYALLVEHELCVCDIANIINATIATTSHHLRKLHKAGITTYRKEGKLAFYSLADSHIKPFIAQGLLNEKDGETYAVQ
ncbi:ArsR/SmtB family transcription factor [Lentibacillus juripiscarius]|uniref:ArsR/SmtB family transcription factor n=1 Tax=Lentibacillus juripiscarius TaxID=257446 RepID=A0ABW5V341_9BACI